jgi:Rieske Fe-S protein
VLPAHPSPLTRRAFVAGTCGAACAAALSACSTYPVGPAPAQSSAAPASPDAQGGAAPNGLAPNGAAPNGAAQGGSAQGGALASTSDIPVGGGTVFAEQDVVVTQPAPGRFRAFSATCTHQGCPVTEVADGTINCNCHGSKFAVADGSVVDGPADTPLPERGIEVTGEEILLA